MPSPIRMLPAASTIPSPATASKSSLPCGEALAVAPKDGFRFSPGKSADAALVVSRHLLTHSLNSVPRRTTMEAVAEAMLRKHGPLIGGYWAVILRNTIPSLDAAGFRGVMEMVKEQHSEDIAEEGIVLLTALAKSPHAEPADIEWIQGWIDALFRCENRDVQYQALHMVVKLSATLAPDWVQNRLDQAVLDHFYIGAVLSAGGDRLEKDWVLKKIQEAAPLEVRGNVLRRSLKLAVDFRIPWTPDASSLRVDLSASVDETGFFVFLARSGTLTTEEVKGLLEDIIYGEMNMDYHSALLILHELGDVVDAPWLQGILEHAFAQDDSCTAFPLLRNLKDKLDPAWIEDQIDRALGIPASQRPSMLVMLELAASAPVLNPDLARRVLERMLEESHSGALHAIEKLGTFGGILAPELIPYILEEALKDPSDDYHYGVALDSLDHFKELLGREWIQEKLDEALKGDRWQVDAALRVVFRLSTFLDPAWIARFNGVPEIQAFQARRG